MNRTILIIVMVVVVVGGIAAWVIFGNGYQSANSNTTTAVSNTNRATTTNTNSTNVNRAANLNANAAASNSNQATANTNAQSNSNANTASSQVSVSATSASGFSPQTVTVKAGGTVTWNNTGTSTVYVAPNTHPEHTDYPGIWEDDGSGRISAGETYRVTFSTPGTYRYHDHNDSGNTGTVIVE